MSIQIVPQAPTDLELFLRENGIEHYLDVLLGEEIESVAMLQEGTDESTTSSRTWALKSGEVAAG